MDLIGITDEIILKMQLKTINRCLEENSSPRTTQVTEYDLDKLLQFNHLNDSIKRFITIFKEKFTEEQTNSLLEKIETLKIKEKNRDYHDGTFRLSLGVYNPSDNVIYINRFRRLGKDLAEETLYHELIHMASTKTTANGTATGFEIPCFIGLSLNEGYTEYLTEKYFTRGSKYVYTDNDDLYFAKGIENIVGSKKMEELFFNANLEGLIQELTKYMRRADVIKLLYSMDKQHQIMKSSKDKRRIINVIAEITAKKLLEDYKNGIITYKEYQIEYAKKVLGYQSGVIWSEETTVIEDNGLFVLYDQGDSSRIYELKNEKREIQKKYQ